jgi:hypothetical protein
MKRAGTDLIRAKLIASLESLGHFEPGVLPSINWSTAYHGGPKTFGYAQWKAASLRCCRTGDATPMGG